MKPEKNKVRSWGPCSVHFGNCIMSMALCFNYLWILSTDPWSEHVEKEIYWLSSSSCSALATYELFQVGPSNSPACILFFTHLSGLKSCSILQQYFKYANTVLRMKAIVVNTTLPVAYSNTRMVFTGIVPWENVTCAAKHPPWRNATCRPVFPFIYVGKHSCDVSMSYAWLMPMPLNLSSIWPWENISPSLKNFTCHAGLADRSLWLRVQRLMVRWDT